MNWLAKINLNAIVRHFGVFKSSILLIGLIVTCVFCGYRMGNYYHHYQSEALEYNKSRLEILYHQQVDQIKRINTLEVALEIEKISSQRSLASLKEIEAAHYQLKEELAFYEKVMVPEKEIDGIVLNEFSVTPTDIPNFYNFKAVLIQQQMQKRSSTGHIDIIISGMRENKQVKLSVKELSSLSEKQLSFNFKFFQSVVGTIVVPENFAPETINIVITLPKSRWQKYRRTEESFQWQEKLNTTEKATPVILD